MSLRPLLIALLLVSGCSPSPTSSPDTVALAAARDRWNEIGAVDYTFTIELQCYCTPEMRGPFEVRVSASGTVVTREKSPVGAEWLVNVPTDADALFAFVEERLGQAGLRVEYDPASGLPTTAWSDPIPGAADDELGISVTTIEIETP